MFSYLLAALLALLCLIVTPTFAKEDSSLTTEHLDEEQNFSEVLLSLAREMNIAVLGTVYLVPPERHPYGGKGSLNAILLDPHNELKRLLQKLDRSGYLSAIGFHF